VIGAVDVVRLVERAVVGVGHTLGLLVGGDGAFEQLVGRGDAVTSSTRWVSTKKKSMSDSESACSTPMRSKPAGVGLPSAKATGSSRSRRGGSRTRVPRCPWVLADVADVSVDSGADLGADGFVCTEEGHVAVGGSAGDDVDEAGVVEVTEGGDDVAVKLAEVVEGLGEEAVPEAGCLGEVGVAGLDEVGFVFSCCDDFSGDVVRELGDEDGVRELLEQDGERLRLQLKRMLSRSRLANMRRSGGRSRRRPRGATPCRAARCVVDDVRQVRVQGEGEEALRFIHCECWRCLRQDKYLGREVL